MKTHSPSRWPSLAIIASTFISLQNAEGAAYSNNLLTNSQETTPWQSCEEAGISIEDPDTFDPTHLEDTGCAYRETPAEAGQSYTFACGVTSTKYSSMTLGFLNAAGETLAEETHEIFEDIDGGTQSVAYTAPAGTVLMAVGIYGLHGSGFQDCTLLPNDDTPPAEDGSVSGLTWFDGNADLVQNNYEPLIPDTRVMLLANGQVIAETTTNSDGAYYFGGLDLERCFTVRFSSADQTLTEAPAGGGNSIVSSGQTTELCLNADTPNLTNINAAYHNAPALEPPRDYALCGLSWMSENNAISTISDVNVVLVDTVSGEQTATRTDADGGFAFASLAAGSYALLFTAPSGFTFAETGTELNAETSIADITSGRTPSFNLPQDSNTGTLDACTIRNINAGFIKTPVTLDPTIARNDVANGLVGELLTVSILENDTPCNDEIESVDIIGHNVPGGVNFDTNTSTVVLSDLTEAGTFSIQYGLRGSCGSYDTAEVQVTIKTAPTAPPPEAPAPPDQCFASIGKKTGTEPGVHVDLFYEGGGRSSFPPELRFYDAEGSLVYTGLVSEIIWAHLDRYAFFRRSDHGVDVLDIASVTAVANGVESNPQECTQRSITPIALDTDLSGRVKKIVGAFYFDMNGDGIDEHLNEWVSPTDGLLIKSDFGQTLTGEHLFGDTGGIFENGFTKLALLDINNDGELTGSELEGLAIWTDRNSNTTVDNHEISALSEHAIESLAVTHYKYAARARLTDGTSLIMQDLWFAVAPLTRASLRGTLQHDNALLP